RAGMGVGGPVWGGARPVWRSSRVPVREALADFGVSKTQFGTTAFDRALAGLGGLARPLLLSIRNGFRRRGRLLSTIATLAAGGGVFMTAGHVPASPVHTPHPLFATRKVDPAVGLAAVRPIAHVAD